MEVNWIELKKPNIAIIGTNQYREVWISGMASRQIRVPMMNVLIIKV
jgi:hypothetical protein